MGILKHMVNKSLGGFLVLLLVSAVSPLEKKETEDDFVRELLDPASGLFNEHTVRLLVFGFCRFLLNIWFVSCSNTKNPKGDQLIVVLELRNFGFLP